MSHRKRYLTVGFIAGLVAEWIIPRREKLFHPAGIIFSISCAFVVLFITTTLNAHG